MEMKHFPDPSDLADPANKLTFFAYRNDFIDLVKHARETSSLHLLDQNLATVHVSVCLHRSLVWNKVFLRKIDQLISAGIAQRIKIKPPTQLKQADIPPMRLTMEHLGVCFIIVAICWGLCFLVFVVELLTNFVRNKFMNLVSENGE